MKKIIILIGPKGSGKSYIGSLFERIFQIKFLRVEDWVKHIKRTRSIDNDDYHKEVFNMIEKGTREFLKQNDTIIFESTGLTVYFDKMLQNLKSDYSVTTIKINAEKDLCLKRVKTRDRSIHINVSDEQVNMINEAVIAKKNIADFEIENSNASEQELEKQIAQIVKEINISH